MAARKNLTELRHLSRFSIVLHVSFIIITKMNRNFNQIEGMSIQQLGVNPVDNFLCAFCGLSATSVSQANPQLQNYKVMTFFCCMIG